MKRNYPTAVKAPPKKDEFTHFVVVSKQKNRPIEIINSVEYSQRGKPEDAINSSVAKYSISTEYDGEDGYYALPAVHHYKSTRNTKIKQVGSTAWVDWYY